MREAALPSAGYASPDNRFLSDGRTIVRVYPEAGRGFKDFSFHALNVAPELQTLLVEGFALATGPSGTRRTIPSAANLFAGISTFVHLIASSPRPPVRTAETSPRAPGGAAHAPHGFRDQCTKCPSGHSSLESRSADAVQKRPLLAHSQRETIDLVRFLHESGVPEHPASSTVRRTRGATAYS